MLKKPLFIFAIIFLSYFFIPLFNTAYAGTSCITESGQSGIISSSTGKCVAVLDITATNSTGTSTTATTTTSTGLVPCGHGSDPANACTVCDFIVGFKKLVDFGSEILITITVVGIFISGIMYIISSGSSLVDQAKKFLAASLTGFTIVLTAWLIINVTMWLVSFNVSTLGITGGSTWYSFTCTK